MQPISQRTWFELLLVAFGVALLAAKPYAGGWNDGSRLAGVEAMVDYGTSSIDRSIFARPSSPDHPSPYPAHDDLLLRFGTLDKMYIDGHYYSDKSPVPGAIMAGAYQLRRRLGGSSAAEDPETFCRLMTFASSGLAYVAAIGCLFAIGVRVGLSQGWAFVLTVVFGGGTVAVAYVQHVNNHILLLAAATAIFLALLQNAHPSRLGCLAGLAYSIDLGAGPPLFAMTGFLVVYEAKKARCAVRAGLLFLGAALPWIALHHALNFAVGGTIGPANAVPEYFNWPGSPFHAGNMTGGWNHRSLGAAVVYALDMLFGKRGFLGHNLPLLLLLPLLPQLLRSNYREKPLVMAGLVWALTTWLLYAATSRNMSGMCCSVRWFVPLLAPGFLTLAIVLRDFPRYRVDFLVLGCGAMLMGIGMAIKGPWTGRMIPFYWPIYAGSLAVWAIVRYRRRHPASMSQVADWRLASRRSPQENQEPEEKLAIRAQDSFVRRE